MSYSNTRRVIRRHLYDQIPVLGFNGTADSVTTGAIVDAFALRDSNLPTNHFKGTFIYRPDRSTDDRIKKAGLLTVATGSLAHTGANYADTSDLEYEIVGLLHPDELNACITRALRKIYYETQVPLTLVPDGDMAASGTTDWINSNATIVKTTTATSVFSGIRSTSITTTSAGGLIQSASINITQGEPVFISFILRASVGTLRCYALDGTSSTVLGYIDTTQLHWQTLWMYLRPPSTCELVALRVAGIASGDAGFWDSAFCYRMNDYRIPAPSWLDEPWKFLKLREAKYQKSINNAPTGGTASSLGGGQFEAASRTFQDWYQPRHFSLDPFTPEANPYSIQLTRSLPQGELWIEGKRPYSSIEPLTADTDATTAPLELVLAHSKLEVAKLLIKRYPNDPKWVTLFNEAEKETQAETMSRPEIPLNPLRINTRGRI